MTKFTQGHDGFYWAPPIDPSDLLDYVMDFSGILGSDSIATVSWAVTGTGATEVSGLRSNTAKTATVWLNGGVAGQDAMITASVVSVGGREFDRSFKILCKNQ